MPPILIPNLPTKFVTHVCACNKNTQVQSALENLGITIYSAPLCNTLPHPINTHNDLLLHHLGGNNLLCQNQMPKTFVDRLEKLGFSVTLTQRTLGDRYPADCLLNACRVGNSLICNPNCIDPILRQYAVANSLSLISSAQGYANCSVCVVREDAIITADRSIAEVAKQHGIEVLVIRAGYIDLPGYDYGFIGGCCGKLAPNLLFFTGDLFAHPDGVIIERFLAEYGVKIICAPNSMLIDIGGIIPLIEQ